MLTVTRGKSPSALPCSISRAQPLGERAGNRRACFRQQPDEFLAADAPDQVLAADLPPCELGNSDQHRVAHLMAETVVDRLEMVDVEHHERQRTAVPIAHAQKAVEPLEGRAAAGKARQRVGHRQLAGFSRERHGALARQ
jgi:hypothetical protein